MYNLKFVSFFSVTEFFFLLCSVLCKELGMTPKQLKLIQMNRDNGFLIRQTVLS